MCSATSVTIVSSPIRYACVCEISSPGLYLAYEKRLWGKPHGTTRLSGPWGGSFPKEGERAVEPIYSASSSEEKSIFLLSLNTVTKARFAQWILPSAEKNNHQPEVVPILSLFRKLRWWPKAEHNNGEIKWRLPLFFPSLLIFLLLLLLIARIRFVQSWRERGRELLTW